MPVTYPGETARPHYPYRMLQLSTEDLKRTPAAPRKREASSQTASNRGGTPTLSAPGTAGGQTPRLEAGTERRTFILPPPNPAKPVEHTLVQLDVPDIAPRSDLRVPEALIWARLEAKRPLKQFIAPSRKPLPRATLQALPVVPKLEVPNQQTEVASLKMSIDPLAIDPRLVLRNATTSPVQLEAKDRGTQLPETTSAAPNQTSAGNLISVPDVTLRTDGMAVTPPANQIAGMRNPDGTAGGSGRGKGAQSGTGEGDGKGIAGASSGQGTGPGGTGKDPLSKTAGGSGGGPAGSNGGSGSGGTGAGTGAASGAGGGTAAGAGGTGGTGDSTGPGRPEMVRIVRPANGNHSAVIFGASASEPYPESAGVLTGKVVYTVYLQVGLRKNWILQYCLPKSFSSESTARGAVSALAPPWPTLMVRPKNNSAPDADYILVHGMITAAGRFVQLATVVPEQFENRKQLLEALQEWEFRPATRDGQPSAVEILLIIPSV